MKLNQDLLQKIQDFEYSFKRGDIVYTACMRVKDGVTLTKGMIQQGAIEFSIVDDKLTATTMYRVRLANGKFANCVESSLGFSKEDLISKMKVVGENVPLTIESTIADEREHEDEDEFNGPLEPMPIVESSRY